MQNELARETSPYLLQHADNPVAWQAWDEAALATAREQGKPLLVSIGYSACHWCHVMAHESFEDDETAALMNELYVNIKIDREERPDLDKVYQLIHQLTTGRPGGWPLTAFLTPEAHLPIFIGTYFPREARFGMPAFKDVLRRVADYYRDHAGEVAAQGEAVIAALAQVEPPATQAELSATLLARARSELERSFDAESGGFGQAPKFPHASNLEFLLAAWRRTATTAAPDLDALTMVARTLTAMAEGGLYDQLGGGFFRYSVDRYWQIPHFEKMLYDNAALLALYSEAHAATGEALYARIATETAAWMLRDMRDPQGGFYATLDADAEGEEGKFYAWAPTALEAALEPALYGVAAPYFGLDGPANFEGHAWHLRISQPLEAVAERNAISLDTATERLAGARSKLLALRDKRVWPLRDEKILTSWNALAARALALAGRHLGQAELIAAAEGAVGFVREHLWSEGRLSAAFKDGRSRFAAYLDDYALLLDALLELLQCRWSNADLAFARELADVLIEQFEDPRGGFFFTAHDHEALVYRPKPFADEALPAGNAVAAGALLKLGHLLGDARALGAAERTLRAAAPLLEHYPHAHCSMLRALEAYLDPPELIVLRGPQHELEHWRRYLHAGYHPQRLVFAIPDDVTELPGFLAELDAGDATLAYVCRGTHCEMPATSLEELIAALGST